MTKKKIKTISSQEQVNEIITKLTELRYLLSKYDLKIECFDGCEYMYSSNKLLFTIYSVNDPTINKQITFNDFQKRA